MGKHEKIQKLAEKGKAPQLAKYIEDRDKETVLAAMEAAGGVDKDETFNALVIRISDADRDIREGAVKALGKMGNPRASAHLSHRLSAEKDEGVLAALKAAMQAVH